MLFDKWSPAIIMISAIIKFAIIISWLENQNNKSGKNKREEDSEVDKEDMV